MILSASLLGAVRYIKGSNNLIFSLGNLNSLESIRIIGADFDESRGTIDFTIYGNNGNGFTARGRSNVSGREIKLYKSGSTVYLQFPTGVSATVCVIGANPIEATLPSGATEITITAYS